MALSISQKVIIGKETSYGVAAASDSDTSTVGNAALPIETASINLIIEPFNDQTKKGAVGLDSMQYPTVRRVEGSLEGSFYTDECAYLLLALFGSELAISTGASNQNTHAFKGKTDFSSPNANSLTIDVRDDVNTSATVGKENLGCYVSAFTLRYSAAEGIMTYTSSIMGATQATSYTLSNTAFAEPVPLFGWTGTFALVDESRSADNEVVNASVINCAIIDCELTINRPTAMMYAFRGTDVVCRADPGPMECTLRLTADWDNAAGITPAQWFGAYTTTGSTYFTKPQIGMRFDLTNGQATTALRTMRIYLPSVSILEGPLEIDRSDTTMRLNLSGRALNNTHANINGPARIKLTSRRATVYGT